MKKRLFLLAALKTIIVIGGILLSAATYAQSVTRKWKMTMAKETITDKASGKTQDISAQIGEITKMTEQIIVFNGDGTYFTSNKMTGSKTGFESSGTYSISGNQLKLNKQKSNVPAFAPQ